MVWLVWIIIGGLVGVLATSVVKSRQGLPTNILVGVVGAFGGTFLFNTIGASGGSALNIGSLLMAILGAAILLGVGRLRVGSVRATY